MRYSSVDKVSFKVFRSDTDNAAPYRVKGCDMCRYIPINIPFEGNATFRIVPGEKAYRKNGYWLDMFFKGGDFSGGTVYMVRNFLPIGAYPILVQGNDARERIGNAWQDFRDLAAPGNEYMFKDIKKDELLDRAQLDWVDFLNKRDSAVAALAKMSVDYWEDPHLSPEVGMCISKFQNACDRYEKKRWARLTSRTPAQWGNGEDSNEKKRTKRKKPTDQIIYRSIRCPNRCPNRTPNRCEIPRRRGIFFCFAFNWGQAPKAGPPYPLQNLPIQCSKGTQVFLT